MTYKPDIYLTAPTEPGDLSPLIARKVVTFASGRPIKLTGGKGEGPGAINGTPILCPSCGGFNVTITAMRNASVSAGCNSCGFLFLMDMEPPA